METFLSVTVLLIVTVGLSELREWRSSRKLKKLELLLKAQRRVMVSLKSESQAMAEVFSKTIDAMNRETEKHATDIQTLAQAIDVHGVRVNFKPGGNQHADYIEGL